MARHGVYPRDVIPPRSEYFDSGRFGRMFGGLPPFAADTPRVRSQLLEIGKAGGIMDAMDDLAAGPILLITDPAKSQDNLNNPNLTAGMTFFGQFLDHDMTLDPTSSLERQVDPEMIANFLTPTLALDNVYGAGPAAARISTIRAPAVAASSSSLKKPGHPTNTICRAIASGSR